MPLVDLVITTGEPAGIGPAVSIEAAQAFLREQGDVRITLVGDPVLFTGMAPSERLLLEPIQLSANAVPGELNAANAQYVLSLLDAAVDGCRTGRFHAMVTAPVHKGIINQSGIPFTGHTEYLAARCHVERVVMMLCANLPAGLFGLDQPLPLRVALATIHLPLAEVPSQISIASVLETIQIVDRDLKDRFGIRCPRIQVAGLNPHAGEGGYLGTEEITLISPAIMQAKQLGIAVEGPFPGDTMFDLRPRNRVDAYIAMYHDQGLAPFKLVSFGGGVNVTLGLPIIRTSVDHGTALDIAAQGSADSGSMLEALRLAFQLAQNQANA